MKNLLVLLILILSVNIYAAELYFPPLYSDEWETLSMGDLNWDSTKIDDLFQFLQIKNTKAFLVLKDGKIVIEKYFDDFQRDSLWYWASAGKTLTAALVGIAQNEGYLSLNEKTSKYLEEHWTSLPEEKEDLITIWHQLTMTSGLDDAVEDVYCTLPECLKYKADAGTRWAYHNAPYTLLEQVVLKATGKSYNDYFNEKLRNKIGMNGLWVKSGYNNVYISNPRSMARFGLMILAGGNWNGEEIIKDKQYFNDMLNTSQDLNKSYGYLWWLNGKESYMVPSLQIKIPGYLFTNAPKDIVSALGKNGQALSISFSHKLIIVRMGEAPGDNELAFKFYNELWDKLNEIINFETGVRDLSEKEVISPYLCNDYLEFELPETEFFGIGKEIKIYNNLGELVSTYELKMIDNGKNIRIDVSQLRDGVYFVRINNYSFKFLVIR